MKFLTTSLTLAAVMASATLAAASESLVDKRSPAVAGHAEPMQRRKTCSSKKSHKKHSKHHHHKSSGKKSSSSSSSSGSSSGKTTDRAAESSSNNDSSSSSSSSSGSKTSGSGKDVKLNSKQGLAWPNAGGISIDKFLQSSISWYYSWGTRPGWNSAPTDIAFCPMLWGDSGSGGNLDDWKKDVIADPDNKWYSAKCMMGPNEVNQKGQSDMSVSDACSLMREHMMPLADKGWYFIGPSTTSAPNGLTQWYKQFQSECSDVFDRFDAISIHWYDVNINNFKEYVQNWHKQTGKDLWITEFACQNFNGGAQCSKQDAQEMMKEMSDWFLQQDYVKAFSPFGAMQNLQGVSEVNRLSNGNNPTSLFEIFANA